MIPKRLKLVMPPSNLQAPKCSPDIEASALQMATFLDGGRDRRRLWQKDCPRETDAAAAAGPVKGTGDFKVPQVEVGKETRRRMAVGKLEHSEPLTWFSERGRDR